MNTSSFVETSSALLAPQPEPATPVLTMEAALARLDRSRERLRDSLTPAPVAPDAGAGHSFHPVRRARAWLRTTPWGGVLDPLLSAVGDELVNWWQRQSWRQSSKLAAQLATDKFTAEVMPLVRRYPIAAVLLTAGAGAIVAGSGVWRWRTVRRSATQLGGQLKRVFFSQLSNPALQSMLLAAVVSYLTPTRQAAGTAQASPHSQPAPHPPPTQDQDAGGS
jgi:hypothetical protein